MKSNLIELKNSRKINTSETDLFFFFFKLGVGGEKKPPVFRPWNAKIFFARVMGQKPEKEHRLSSIWWQQEKDGVWILRSKKKEGWGFWPPCCLSWWGKEGRAPGWEGLERGGNSQWARRGSLMDVGGWESQSLEAGQPPVYPTRYTQGLWGNPATPPSPPR